MTTPDTATDVPQSSITRIFDAPCELVGRPWTDEAGLGGEIVG